MFCPKCGKQNGEKIDFCQGCGERLSAVPQPPLAAAIQTGKKKKPVWVWVVGVLAFLLIVGAMSKDDEGSSGDTNAVSTSQVEQPRISEKPKVDWKTQALTADLIKAQFSGEDEANLKVEIDGNEVSVVHIEESVWNEATLVEGLGSDHIDACEKLFVHPKIQMVTSYASTSMVDQYGNEEIERVASVTWNRAIHQKINYEKFRYLDRGYQAYSVADAYWIHPGVFKKLDKQDRLDYENLRVGE